MTIECELQTVISSSFAVEVGNIVDWQELEGCTYNYSFCVNIEKNTVSTVTYGVDIRLQSPEQFKDFFYKAARTLKAMEQDFMDELPGISRVPEAAPSSVNELYFYRDEFSADKVMDHVKEAVAFAEAEAAGNFEVTDEQLALPYLWGWQSIAAGILWIPGIPLYMNI
jgi:hypothetical protein